MKTRDQSRPNAAQAPQVDPAAIPLHAAVMAYVGPFLEGKAGVEFRPLIHGGDLAQGFTARLVPGGLSPEPPKEVEVGVVTIYFDGDPIQVMASDSIDDLYRILDIDTDRELVRLGGGPELDHVLPRGDPRRINDGDAFTCRFNPDLAPG
jgi:hypothetical protein